MCNRKRRERGKKGEEEVAGIQFQDTPLERKKNDE